MSLLRTFNPRLIQTVKPGAGAYTAISSFHSTTARHGLKESDHGRDDLHNIYEAEKQDGLRNTREGKGKWKQELASNSEASIKADREEIDTDGMNFEEMQRKTKNMPNQNGSGNKTQ
ncbi:hypothetical protein FE257_004871 [Aspergillus nanangensis]|uniref:Uncharacterized protein n=1 Tax=Aspergillus nanangensis TaxID=2582783 RepID=A0AAD4CAN1_ASPNN|nr:hypothetical protein FE257_004871 [Aspergillus nanangensis]